MMIIETSFTTNFLFHYFSIQLYTIYHLIFLKHFLPKYTPYYPSYSSILRSSLYFANLYDLQGAPVFICPLERPTTKWAIKVS